MLELFFFPSPNCWKVSIALEELGLRYRLVPIDILAGAQDDPEFRSVSPNGRVPAVRDPATGETRFESGAILLWLAERTGRLLPPGDARFEAIEWLFWQMAGLGPMAGQAHHFLRYAPAGTQYAADRFAAECRRLYRVLDRRLEGRAVIAGNSVSIADIACWPWVWFHRMHGIDLGAFPEVGRWFRAMGRRPAVRRGRTVGLGMLAPEIRPLFAGPAWAGPPERGADLTRVPPS